MSTVLASGHHGRCHFGTSGLVVPEVLQSGFRGEFPILVQRIFRKIASEFDGDFFRDFFSLVFFPGFQAPSENSRPNVTPRIVGIPLQCHFLEPDFSGDSLLTVVFMCCLAAASLVTRIATTSNRKSLATAIATQ